MAKQNEEQGERIMRVTHSEMKKNDHAWALMDGKLVVVMRTSERGSYEVCGAWGSGVGSQSVTLISRIEVPKGHERKPFYYDEYTMNNSPIERENLRNAE